MWRFPISGGATVETSDETRNPQLAIIEVNGESSMGFPNGGSLQVSLSKKINSSVQIPAVFAAEVSSANNCRSLTASAEQLTGFWRKAAALTEVVFWTMLSE